MTENIVDELSDLMPHELIIEPAVSRTGSGAWNYGPEIRVKARCRVKTHVVIGPDGEEHTASIMCTLDGAYGLKVEDRYTLPAEFSRDRFNPDNIPARQRGAKAVDMFPDENGPHHEKVHF